MIKIRKDIDPLLLEYSSNLDNKFNILETLGEGRYSKYSSKLRVKLGLNMVTNKFQAIKILRRGTLNNKKKIERFL